MSSPSLIASFPPELLLEIANHLPPPARSAFCRTCRYYNSVCNQPSKSYVVKNIDPYFYRAALAGRTRAMSFYLKMGGKPDPSQIDGGLLATIAKSGLAEVMRILLEAGADPNQSDWTSTTPLYYAVASGNPEMAWRLLQKGARADCSVRCVLDEKDPIMKALFRKFGIW